MKGMKLRVPPAPLFLMFDQIRRGQRHADRLRRSVSGIAAGHGGWARRNPLPTIMAKKFYEVQSHIMLTGHITESLVTIVGSHVWPKLSDEDKKVFEDALKEASAKSTDQIRASELKLADEFRKLGKTVVEVDREAFRKVAVPLHNDPSAGAGWSQAEYDALQVLK